MSSSARRDKLRSFILDVPTRSHLNSPNEEEASTFPKNFLLAKPISRFEPSKSISRSNSSLPDDGKLTSPTQLSFALKFLPFINAQHGPSRVKAILTSASTYQAVESLPIIRKRHEVDILLDPGIEKPSAIMRNKSLEVSRIE